MALLDQALAKCVAIDSAYKEDAVFFEFAVILLPLFSITAFLMIGRYYEQLCKCTGLACVRRRRVVDQVLLDSPGPAGMDVTHFKHYMDVCSDETGQARYNTAPLAASGLRVIADNAFTEEDVPLSGDWNSIISQDTKFAIIAID